MMEEWIKLYSTHITHRDMWVERVVLGGKESRFQLKTC